MNTIMDNGVSELHQERSEECLCRVKWDGLGFSFIWLQELVVKWMLRIFLAQKRKNVFVQNIASSRDNVKMGIRLSVRLF